jgi:hypothetical protein
MAQQNIENVVRDAPAETLHSGASWYGNVHEATAKGASDIGMPIKHAAGVVAAVSPNMDWDKNNINAFGELHSLSGRQWQHVADSAASTRQAQIYNHSRGYGKTHPLRAETGRTDEAKDALQGMSISASTDGGLLKAKRILDGEDPEDVLNRRTAPKTNSFMHNIAYPDVSGHVTIDGRAHDIAANRLQGWTENRGIGSAALTRGTSRYEHFEDAYRGATAHINSDLGMNLHPHDVQAIAWTHAKTLERSVPTATGEQRLNGVQRTGQSYDDVKRAGLR